MPNDQYDNIVVSKDYVACAANHCGCRAVLKLDIGSFFDNVEEQHVYSVFSKLLRFPPDVCNQLVKICCHNGHLVQGALTSSYIASAVLFDVEPLVVSRLHKKGLVYTRLVDDITVSSRDVNYDFSFAESIILDMLSSKDLPVNNAKTTIIKASTSEILIHGLRVSFSEPRLPSSEVSRIRASVQNIESLSRIADYRVSRDYRTSFNRCLGRVNKLARLGHKQHKTLLERINRIPPLPSKSDIKRLDKYISKLEAWYLDNNDEYWYRRLYYKACYDLSILNRSFPCVASEYKLRMKAIRPLYVD